MQQFIRKWLRSAGYDLVKYTPARSRDLRLLKLLQHFQIDTLLDVGANKGQYARQLRATGYTGKIISLEPMPAAHAQLAKAAASDSKWQVPPPIALGAESGSLPLNLAANSVSSSLLPMTDLHTQAAPESGYKGAIQVPVQTLDAFMAAEVPNPGRLFIKLDTQGYEDRILAGGPATLAMATGLQLELSLVTLYEGQQLFDALYERLKSLGFFPYSLEPGFTDPNTGQVLQLEGIFFRQP